MVYLYQNGYLNYQAGLNEIFSGIGFYLEMNSSLLIFGEVEFTLS